MSHIGGESSIREYNLDIARGLMAPADYFPGENSGCLDAVCQVVSHVWIFIHRMLNYLFGDRQWYNNQVAHDLVADYCLRLGQATPVDSPDGMHEKITALYEALRFRAYHSPEQGINSYADHLESLTQGGGQESMVQLLHPVSPSTEVLPPQTGRLRIPLVREEEPLDPLSNVSEEGQALQNRVNACDLSNQSEGELPERQIEVENSSNIVSNEHIARAHSENSAQASSRDSDQSAQGHLYRSTCYTPQLMDRDVQTLVSVISSAALSSRSCTTPPAPSRAGQVTVAPLNPARPTQTASSQSQPGNQELNALLSIFAGMRPPIAASGDGLHGFSGRPIPLPQRHNVQPSVQQTRTPASVQQRQGQTTLPGAIPVDPHVLQVIQQAFPQLSRPVLEGLAIASPQRIQEWYQIAMRHLDTVSEELQARHLEGLQHLTNQVFCKGETGNIILKQKMENLHNEGDEITVIHETLLVLDESLKNHSFLLHEVENPTPEAYEKVYQELCQIYGARKFKYRNDQEHKQDLISEKNPDYADAQDPCDLFARALCDACRDVRSIQSRYGFSNGAFNNYALMMMVVHLLQQADVKTDDCAGPYVQFNNHIQVRYQKPILIFAQENEEMVPCIVYNTDSISSTYQGCDPEGAKRILTMLQEEGKLEAFRDYLFMNTPPAHESMPLLKDLIQQMSQQISQRYSPALTTKCNRRYYRNTVHANRFPQCVHAPLRNATFKTYTQSAETVYEYMSRATVWAAQKYANKGLLNLDDIYDAGEAYTHLRALIGSNAIFEMLKNAERYNDFTLSFNHTLQMNLGKFFSFEPSSDNPRLLTANERYIPHMFGGVGTIEDIATDPIKAKTLMQKLSYNELQFAERYIYSSHLLSLYALKNITDEEPLRLLQNAREELEQMDTEKKRIIQDLNVEILKMQSYFAEHHFNTLLNLFESTITIPENAFPTVITFAQPVQETPPEYQEVLWQYLPESVDRNSVVGKNPVPRNIGTSVKVSWRDYHGRRYQALQAQNTIIDNPARCGNCMYGALAIELFGINTDDDDEDNDEVEYFAGILRQTAVNYMLTNPDQFLQSMVDPARDHQRAEETDQAFNERMQPIWMERLRNHCRKVAGNDADDPEWGTAVEMSAISAVFGIPIHIFYTAHPMEIGTNGIDEGVILPNSVIGGNFAGEPLRYIYTGQHYEPIHLRTVFSE